MYPLKHHCCSYHEQFLFSLLLLLIAVRYIIWSDKLVSEKVCHREWIMHQTYHCLVYVTANSCLRLLPYYLLLSLISYHLHHHPIAISSLLDESSPLALQEIKVGVSAKTQDIASMYWCIVMWQLGQCLAMQENGKRMVVVFYVLSS